MEEKIVTIEKKSDERFLREKTRDFDFSKHSKKDIRELVKNMRLMMKKANGVGLSANQIGLHHKVFVAQVPDSQNQLKFYAIFNPKIEKASVEKEILEEGCLSIPESYGSVPRSYRLTLIGQDQAGKKIKIKAWGLLARVFQHECDHLDGKLFIDRTKQVLKKEPAHHDK
ncbi:MAG: peptide deformylase [Patescibacteria group bacterium]